MQPHSIASARSASASRGEVWRRWMPLWHGFFYAPLLFCTVILFIGSSYNWQEDAALLGLSLLIGALYSISVIVEPVYWQQHQAVALGYLALEWACWAVLIILSPNYLLLLCGLYPQAFMILRLPGKIIAACVLTGLCLWRETIVFGAWNPGFFISLSAGIVGVIMATFIAAIIEQSIARRQLIHELEATRQELAAAEREKGVIDERQRLAREIHDTLAQGFTSIIMHLEAIDGLSHSDRESLQRHLAHVSRTARESLAETRRLMWALQPEAFEHASLAEVLVHLAAHWSEENAVPTQATVTGTARSLRPEIEVTLLRAAQEALANIRKYACASQVTLTLSYMDDMVALDVQDNGRGFDPARTSVRSGEQSAGGFGLKALRERIEQLGGTLSIESAVGEGTTLAVSLPALNRESPLYSLTEPAKEYSL